jgi:hypothetical protein
LEGYYKGGEGGGGRFLWVPQDPGIEDYALVVRPTVGPAGHYARAISGPLSLRWFGARCDGHTDDSAAIELWLNALANGKAGYVPAATCSFTRPLRIVGNNVSIAGAGGSISILKYTGIPSTIDIVSIGESAVESTGWTLRGLKITSSTRMTGDAALHFRRFTRSFISDLIIDGQDGLGTLCHEIWFDMVDDVIYSNFQVFSNGDAIRVNGALGEGPKADLF